MNVFIYFFGLGWKVSDLLTLLYGIAGVILHSHLMTVFFSTEVKAGTHVVCVRSFNVTKYSNRHVLICCIM